MASPQKLHELRLNEPGALGDDLADKVGARAKQILQDQARNLLSEVLLRKTPQVGIEVLPGTEVNLRVKQGGSASREVIDHAITNAPTTEGNWKPKS